MRCFVVCDFRCCVCNVLYLIYLVHLFVLFFFFKQKTAYEMRISDWSSDVCSSDLSTAVWRDILALFLDSAAGFGGGFREVWPQVINKTSPSRAVYWPRCCSRGPAPKRQIGRASCRERVCQSV